MTDFGNISELVISSIGIGGLLAFVAWVIGSVIYIIINTMKKG